MRQSINRPRFDYTPAEGMYFVGPGKPLLVRDAAGVNRECHPGDPIPEAFSFRPNRRRAMLAKQRLRFVPAGALADGVLLRMVKGLTKEARAELTNAAGVKPDATDAELSAALALQGMAGLAKALPPGTRPTRVKPGRRAQEKAKAAAEEKTRPKPLRADAFDDLKAFADAAIVADGATVEAALAEAGLLGRLVNAARIAERDAAKRARGIERSAFTSEKDFEEALEKAKAIVIPPCKALDAIKEARRRRLKVKGSEAEVGAGGVADLARCVLLEPEAFEFQPKIKKG